MKNWLLLGLIVILLVSPGTVVSCGKTSIPGTYVNQDNPSEYLELKEDGTFHLKESGLSLDGEWEAEGDELRLHLMGMVATAQIKGNKIIDEDGEVWVKTKEAPPSLTEPSPVLPERKPEPPKPAPLAVGWTMFLHDAQNSSRSQAVGPESPTVKWSLELPIFGHHPFPPLVDAEGNIYIISPGGVDKVLKVNPGGQYKVLAKAREGEFFGAGAIGSAGHLFLVGGRLESGERYLLVLDKDGSELERIELGALGEAVDWWLAVGPEETVYTLWRKGGIWFCLLAVPRGCARCLSTGLPSLRWQRTALYTLSAPMAKRRRMMLMAQ